MNKRRMMESLAATAVGMMTIAQGATLELTDGSTLQGEVVKIHKDVVHFTTSFAGTLEVPMEQVTALSTEEAVSLRTRSGEVFVGPVSAQGEGRIEVASGSGTARTRLADVEAAWSPGKRDPEVVARETALEDQLRKWRFSVGADITGSGGNTDEFGSSLHFDATLEGPSDRLKFYGMYNYRKTEGVTSDDEQLGGVRYTNFFTERWGWFARQELERDVFEGVEFRSTTAAGITRRFIKRERLELEGSAGISYRYEDYFDPMAESDDFPGLDFGLDLDWQFADWGRWTSSLAYVPSVDDFGDYLFEHESGVNIPLGNSDFWTLRLGLAHQYNSQPSGGRDRLDTTYFARLLLSWE